MKIAVLLKEVVDLVEELSVMDDGSGVERDYLMFRSNEFDDYALEEALQMKKAGHSVDVYAIDGNEADALLHAALAKGADNLFKVKSSALDPDQGISSRTAAHAFYEAIKDKGYDLIYTGVLGVTDVDGPVAGHLSNLMNLPHLSVIVKVEAVDDNHVQCLKELPGGVLAEYTVELPAIFGIQASREPPGYLPIAKIRKAAKEANITELDVTVADLPVVHISHAELPKSGKGAEMVGGSPAEQAAKLIEIFMAKGVLN